MYPQLLPPPFLPGNGGATEADLRLFGWPKMKKICLISIYIYWFIYIYIHIYIYGVYDLYTYISLHMYIYIYIQCVCSIQYWYYVYGTNLSLSLFLMNMMHLVIWCIIYIWMFSQIHRRFLIVVNVHVYKVHAYTRMLKSCLNYLFCSPAYGFYVPALLRPHRKYNLFEVQWHILNPKILYVMLRCHWGKGLRAWLYVTSWILRCHWGKGLGMT